MATIRPCPDCGELITGRGKVRCPSCAERQRQKKKHEAYIKYTEKKKLEGLKPGEHDAAPAQQRMSSVQYDETGHMVGHEYVTIRITKRIAKLWAELTPEVGSIHEARKEHCYPHAEVCNYIIRMGGKLVIIHDDECEEVAG